MIISMWQEGLWHMDAFLSGKHKVDLPMTQPCWSALYEGILPYLDPSIQSSLAKWFPNYGSQTSGSQPAFWSQNWQAIADNKSVFSPMETEKSNMCVLTHE